VDCSVMTVERWYSVSSEQECTELTRILTFCGERRVQMSVRIIQPYSVAPRTMKCNNNSNRVNHFCDVAMVTALSLRRVIAARTAAWRYDLIHIRQTYHVSGKQATVPQVYNEHKPCEGQTPCC
jgi:hypothetical protein